MYQKLSWMPIAFVMLSAGAACGQSVILNADFNGSSLQGAGGVTEPNLNAGTTGGTWTINNVEDSLIGEATTDPANHALAGDRGPYDFDLDLDSSFPLLATDGVEVSLDWQIVRTLNTAEEKKNFFTGYDSLGDSVFELVLTTDGTGTDRGRLKYVDQSGAEIVLADDLPSVDSSPSQFVVDELTNVRIELASATMDIFVDDILQADDVAYRNLGVADLAGFSLVGAGPGNVDNSDAGAWFDNIQVSTNPIPEPSSFALAALGLVSLVGFAWRVRC